MVDVVARGGPADGAQAASGAALLQVNSKWVLTIGVMSAQIMQILDTTIANVALPHMRASLGATTDTITWVLTSYIIATAIALPATGWLSDRFGSRNLFLMAIGGFVLSSMLCGTAVGLEEMVIFRILQGVFAAFINPLSQTAMLDINAPKDQPRAMSLWAMGVMIGPIMGPVIGGILTESYSWRWVFYVNVPIGLLTFAILWFLLPARPRQVRGFDGVGFVLLGVTVASFQLILDRGQQQDWFASNEIILYGLILVAGLWMTVVHLATGRNPLFDRRLYRDRNLMLSMVFMVVVGVSTMAPLALLPSMLQQIYGYSVVDTGLMMAPRGIGVMVATFFAARLMTRIDTRLIVMTGFAIFALSVYMMSGWALEMGARPVITSGFVQGLGMGCVFMPLNSLAFATLDPRQRTDGSSLLNLARSIGQSAGVSIVTLLLARNIQVSHADLAQYMSPDRIAVPGIQNFGAGGVLSDRLIAMADALVNQQAAFIAYIDDFYLVTWVALAAAPLVILLRRPRGRLETVIAE